MRSRGPGVGHLQGTYAIQLLDGNLTNVRLLQHFWKTQNSIFWHHIQVTLLSTCDVDFNEDFHDFPELAAGFPLAGGEVAESPDSCTELASLHV